MPKLILAVVLIVCVGAVMGLMGYVLTKKQVEVEAPEVKTPDEIVEDKTDDWQTYRNEEFGFSITFNEEYKDIWESETHHFNADMNSRSLARTDFYFKDYPLHIFSTVIVYEKEWFVENNEKRVQYKEWSAKNNGTIEEYNKIRDEMKSEFIREKGEIAWLKGDSDGYPLGTYLGENNDYVFILGIGPNGCMATELLCSLPIRKITMDSFQIIDTDSDWQTYRNEDIKYEMKYPKDWTIKENNYLHPFGEYIKNVQFFGPNEKYVLLFGIKQKDADFRLDGRTGIGAGDFVKDDRLIKISGVDVEIENLVYEEKIKEVWYKYFYIDDFVGKATFSFENNINSDDNLNLKNTKELQIAEKILESFKFINQDQSNTSDRKTYRNEEYGFEFQYPAYLNVHEKDEKIRFSYGHGDITIAASKKVGIEEVESYKCVVGGEKPTGNYSHDITSYECSEIQSKNGFDIFKISYRSGHWNGNRKIYNLIKKIDDKSFMVVIINTQEMSADGMASSLKIIE